MTREQAREVIGRMLWGPPGDVSAIERGQALTFAHEFLAPRNKMVEALRELLPLGHPLREAD